MIYVDVKVNSHYLYKDIIMENKNLTAIAETSIEAPASKVWEALVTPEIIKQYMLGTTVTSDWAVGSSITWKGEWEGKKYEDKGKIIQFVPEDKLHFTHYGWQIRNEDVPGDYQNVRIDLYEKENKTAVYLTQDRNDSLDDRLDSEKNWNIMLTSLKELLEKK